MTHGVAADLPASVELLVASLRFPDECVRCGRPATGRWSLEAKRGIDLIIVSYFEYLSIPVPVCTTCKRRRRIVGLVAWALPFMPLPLGAVLAELGLVPESNALVMGAIGLSLASFLALRWFGERILDGPLLGIRAGRLPADKQHVTLHFARGMLAHRVESLSRAPRDTGHAG